MNQIEINTLRIFNFFYEHTYGAIIFKEGLLEYNEFLEAEFKVFTEYLDIRMSSDLRVLFNFCFLPDFNLLKKDAGKISLTIEGLYLLFCLKKDISSDILKKLEELSKGITVEVIDI